MAFLSRVAVGVGVALLAASCGGGGGHPSGVTGGADNKGVAEAARACRMWKEMVDRATATAKSPDIPALTAMANAVTPVANQAAADDPTGWSQLALDLGAGIDFKSAALPDIVARVNKDCATVPASAARAAAAEPDPYAGTTTTPP